MSTAAAERLAAGVTLFGYTLPTAIEPAITCVFAVVFRTLAVNGLGKPEQQHQRDLGLWERLAAARYASGERGL